MKKTAPLQIQTGGDPRLLPDYSALRDELAKLNHPARPDVDWQRVEQLSLSLFRHNGVELQTACWYTLARTHLAAMAGLNEGLAILDVLITRQWGNMWPQPVHARMEILAGFSQRLQKLMRTLALHYADLPLIYQAEKHLNVLCEALQRLELRHISQLQGLCTFMQNAAARLENTDGSETEEAAVSLPATMAMTSTPEPAAASGPLVYTAHEAPPVARVVTATSAPPRGRSWGAFIAGMLTMLVVGGAGLWGWQYLHRPDPIQTQLVASLAPLPEMLTPEQVNILRQQTPLPQGFIAQTQQLLARLDKLPPDWNITYARKLTEQAQALWPEQANPLIQQWQRQINVSVLPVDTMNGWHEGMTQLQTLADKLNALDGQKGKYITVSELKSQVFGMLTSFRQTVPVEEQLRQLKLLPEDSPQRQQQIQQAEQHLRAQVYMLAQEKHRE